MARPVRVVNPWSVGGGGKLRELIVVHWGWHLAWRILVWIVLHPAHVGAPALVVAVGVWTGIWWLGVAAGVIFAALVVTGWVAWTARRGCAAGLGAILSGMSRRRRIDRRWPSLAHQAGIHSKGNTEHVPPLRKWRITQTGVEAVCVTGVIGQHARVVAKQADDLASGVFADRCAVKVLNPSSALVRWDWGRHLGAECRLADVQPPTAPNMVSFGITEDGEPAELVANLSVLAGGASGSGKSTFAWAWLAGYIAAGIPIRVRVVDPGRVEFDALRKHLEKHGAENGITHQYVHQTTGLDQFWRGLDRALEARLDAVSKKGVREHVPTQEEPLDILLIDELLPYAKDLKSDGTGHVIGKIAFLGRKAGYLVCALSQVGQVDTLGRARDVFPQRLCYRTMNPDATGAILGGYPESQGAPCSEIDINDRGVFYFTPPGRKGYTAGRCANVPDAETKVIAGGRLPEPPADKRLALVLSPHVLYRYWGQVGTPVEGQLLYIGISNDLERRHAEHQRAADEREWMQYAGEPEVRNEDHYPNRDLAETAEAKAIKREKPLHNDLFNHGNPRRVRRLFNGKAS